jgi:hypothetical protein
MGREDGTDKVDSVGGSASSGSASSGMSDNFGMHDDSFGQQEYGGPNNLGGLNEDHMRASFNAVNQITDKNPYGKDGIFSRVLGIDPSKIDYSSRTTSFQNLQTQQTLRASLVITVNLIPLLWVSFARGYKKQIIRPHTVL